MRDDKREIVDLLNEAGMNGSNVMNTHRNISANGDLKLKLSMQSHVEKPGEYLIPLAVHYREEYDGHVRLDASNSNGNYHLNVFEGQHDDLDRSELRGEMIQHR